MLAATDDKVIMERDADGLRRLAHLFRHFDIGAGGRDIAGSCSG